MTTNAGSISLLAPGATNSTALAVGIDTSTAGAKNGTATVALTSNGSGSSALGTTPLAAQTVNVTGFVYSGFGVWNVNGSAAWNATANWQLLGGVPGLDAGFTTTDTATFGSAATSANPLVSLDGVSPSLQAITFDNTTHSYTLAQGTGGVLKLDHGGNAATIANSGGEHSISAPLELRSDAAVSVAAGSTLILSGSISESSGAKTLTKSGPGTLILSGTQSYTTLTTNAGTTEVNSALGSGAATVNANAAINFTTDQKLTALNIGAGGIVTLTEPALASAPEDFTPVVEPSGLTNSSPAPVPEPGAFSLLCLGALAICGRRRRNERA